MYEASIVIYHILDVAKSPSLNHMSRLFSSQLLSICFQLCHSLRHAFDNRWGIEDMSDRFLSSNCFGPFGVLW